MMDEVLPAYRRWAADRRRCSCRSPPARPSAGTRPRTSATRRDRPGHAQHAGRDRPRHHRRLCQLRGSPRRSASCADALLAAVGEVAWVEDEALIDAVTAVSGSGPAYVFLLIEALAEAGAAAGLPAELAMRLARATVAGGGELARLSPETAGAAARERHQPGRHDARRARRADGR